MTTISINDTTRATNAGVWCSENISNDKWDLNVIGLFTSQVSYDFLFRDDRQATEFALRWL